VRPIAIALVVLLAGCASSGPQAVAKTDECRPDIDRLQAQLAAEVAERQRITRAAARREETLRKQLEAMKSIERGILEREDRARTETR
jgi:outer membrane murein-binding lipoprotein Lpp